MKIKLSNFLYYKFFSLPEIQISSNDQIMKRFIAVVPQKHLWSEGHVSHSETTCIINTLVSIVNQAYIIGEHSMWKENIRTNPNDLKNKLSNEMIILLISVNEESERKEDEIEEISIDQDTVIGQILCDINFDINEHRAEFGMFAVHEKYQNLGLGKFLILTAEERARNAGCESLQCELLSPTKYEHDVKARLRVWYQKLGYKIELEKDKDGNAVLLEDGTEKSKDNFHSHCSISLEFAQIVTNLAVECKLEKLVKELL